MAVVAAGIDADTSAVGLTFGAATTARGAYATAADATGTGGLAGPAMSRIGAEIAATIDRAAIRNTNRAVRALADSAPTLDGNELTFANLAARSTVVHIRLEIDTDTAAVGQADPTGRGVALGRSTCRAASRDGHRGQESECLAA
jgi:hypothetical protein